MESLSYGIMVCDRMIKMVKKTIADKLIRNPRRRPRNVFRIAGVPCHGWRIPGHGGYMRAENATKRSSYRKMIPLERPLFLPDGSRAPKPSRAVIQQWSDQAKFPGNTSTWVAARSLVRTFLCSNRINTCAGSSDCRRGGADRYCFQRYGTAGRTSRRHHHRRISDWQGSAPGGARGFHQ